VYEVRLLTLPESWIETGNNVLPCHEVQALRRELGYQGIKLRLAVLEKLDLPHDRFIFAANQSLNVPPILTVFKKTRISEFAPSNITSEDFESWWEEATEVNLDIPCAESRRRIVNSRSLASLENNKRLKGEVIKYEWDRGFGFLKVKGFGKNVFFHRSDVPQQFREHIYEGRHFEFIVQITEKGPRAYEIRVLDNVAKK
jgi:cold shock CspA family protein